MSILQNLPGGMQFPWEIGKSNRAKNRYGNIASCEYMSLINQGVSVVKVIHNSSSLNKGNHDFDPVWMPN